jgi:polysaccharide biosynthesis/export protein
MSLKSIPKPCRIKVVPFIGSGPLNLMRNSSRALNLVVVSLFCLVSFGQQAPVIPDPSQKPSSKDLPKNDLEHKPENGVGASVDSNTYKVGPADVLMVKVWNEDKFSGPVVVHQDGKITLPLVGDLDAGGTTPRDIEGTITKALTKYVVKPLVTVTVQAVESKKYYLDGQINHPGEFPLDRPTTILEAISKAGGLQDFANKKKIYILRGDKKIPFNYKEVINGKNMEQNIPLEPGDHVFVP